MYPRLTSLLVAGFILLLVFAILTAMTAYSCRTAVRDSFVAGIDDFDEESQPWEEVELAPLDVKSRLFYMQRSCHPFLAEYTRRIRFACPDGVPVMKPLMVNTGGRTMINVYWYSKHAEGGPYLRLADHLGEHLIDLGKNTTYLVVRNGDRSFAGELQERDRSWGSSRDENGNPCAQVGGRPTVDRSDLLCSPGEYIGRIEGRSGPLRFVSAQRSPEQPPDPTARYNAENPPEPASGPG